MIFTDAQGKKTFLVAGDTVKLKDGRTVVITQTVGQNIILGGDAVVKSLTEIEPNTTITVNDIAEIVKLCFSLIRLIRKLFNF